MNQKFLDKPSCGKVEMKVLEYLAENKEVLIQPLGKGISKAYKVVFEAVKRLKKNGFIEEGKPKRTHPTYKLSSLGVLFVMAYTRDNNVVKQVMRNYEGNVVQDYQTYTNLEQELGFDLVAKFLRWSAKSIFVYGESASNVNTQLVLLLTMNRTAGFSQSELRKLKRAVLKIPEMRETVQNMRQKLTENFDDYLNKGDWIAD